MRSQTARRGLDIQTLARCALCAALLALCAWISVPTAVPFTLQTFGVFFACELLGAAAIWPVLLYLLLGAVGLPVFAGFSGGLALLLGPTGGYLFGFVAIVLLTAAWRRVLGGRLPLVGMLLGLAVCYLLGTVWFVRVYARDGGTVSFFTALTWCVFPYVIPDVLKLLLARAVCKRVKAAMREGES